MCLSLRVKGARAPKPCIAAEDIYVYKVLSVFNEDSTPEVYSPYQSYRYRFNERITAPRFGFDKNWRGEWEVEEGLHSFSSFAEGEYRADMISNRYLFVAIIPKGAKYYHGFFGGDAVQRNSYVSNELIVLHRRDPRSLAIMSNGYSKDSRVRNKQIRRGFNPNEPLVA